MAQQSTAFIPQADAGNAIHWREAGLRGSALPGFVPTALRAFCSGLGVLIQSGLGTRL